MKWNFIALSVALSYTKSMKALLVSFVLLGLLWPWEARTDDRTLLHFTTAATATYTLNYLFEAAGWNDKESALFRSIFAGTLVQFGGIAHEMSSGARTIEYDDLGANLAGSVGAAVLINISY